MATRPLAAPYAGGVPLLMGTAALICGLSVLAGALGSPDGTLAIAAFSAPEARIPEADDNPLATLRRNGDCARRTDGAGRSARPERDSRATRSRRAALR